MVQVIILFIVLLIIGLPIAYVLGISGLAYLFFAGGNIYLTMVPDKMFSGINGFVLLAVPFFMLTGEIMNKAGISERLMRFCNLVVGKVRGGIGYVAILSSFIFAGISGSAIAEVTALGSVLIPAMEKDGMEKDFSAALIASASVLGPIIPPSILAVIYGSMTGVSIGAIFAGAIIPGVLIALSNAFILFFRAKKHNYPRHQLSASPREVYDILKEAILAIIMPLIIIGSILTGVATPTEAAVLAVVYSLIVSMLIFKSLKFRDLKPLLVKTAKNSTILLILMGTASIFGWMLAMEQIPQQVATGFLSLTSNPQVYLLMVVFLVIFVGTFMEVTAAAILLVPILAPVALSLGIHPVHFAIVFLIADFIGVVTPPVGVCLFASCSISKEPIEKVSIALIPFIIAEITTVIVIALVPEAVLFIPRLLGLI